MHSPNIIINKSNSKCNYMIKNKSNSDNMNKSSSMCNIFIKNNNKSDIMIRRNSRPICNIIIKKAGSICPVTEHTWQQKCVGLPVTGQITVKSSSMPRDEAWNR